MSAGMCMSQDVLEANLTTASPHHAGTPGDVPMELSQDGPRARYPGHPAHLQCSQLPRPINGLTPCLDISGPPHCSVALGQYFPLALDHINDFVPVGLLPPRGLGVGGGGGGRGAGTYPHNPGSGVDRATELPQGGPGPGSIAPPPLCGPPSYILHKAVEVNIRHLSSRRYK